MAKEIGNTDLEIEFSNTVGPPDIVYTADIGIDGISVISTDATKAKADGKAICIFSISYSFTPAFPCPHTSVLYDFVTGTGTIFAGSTKCKADNQACMLKEDAGACIGTWKLIAVPFTIQPCACTTEIADAGQTKVKGT